VRATSKEVIGLTPERRIRSAEVLPPGLLPGVPVAEDQRGVSGIPSLHPRPLVRVHRAINERPEAFSPHLIRRRQRGHRGPYRRSGLGIG